MNKIETGQIWDWKHGKNMSVLIIDNGAKKDSVIAIFNDFSSKWLTKSGLLKNFLFVGVSKPLNMLAGKRGAYET